MCAFSNTDKQSLPKEHLSPNEALGVGGYCLSVFKKYDERVNLMHIY